MVTTINTIVVTLGAVFIAYLISHSHITFHVKKEDIVDNVRLKELQQDMAREMASMTEDDKELPTFDNVMRAVQEIVGGELDD